MVLAKSIYDRTGIERQTKVIQGVTYSFLLFEGGTKAVFIIKLILEVTLKPQVSISQSHMKASEIMEQELLCAKLWNNRDFNF